MAEHEPIRIVNQPIQPETRDLNQLPHDEWIAHMSEIFPVLDPQELALDINALKDVAKHTVAVKKRNKIQSIGHSAAVPVILMGALGAVYGEPTAVKIASMGIASASVFSPVLISITIALTGNDERSALKQAIVEWNNTGKGILHQKRDEMM